MAHITISAGTNGEKTTVSEMRKRLARVLSKLDGDQEVSFSFAASLDSYRPSRGIPKIPDSPDTRHARLASCPKILEAPYNLAKKYARCGLGIDHDNDGNCGVCAKKSDAEIRSGLWAYAQFAEQSQGQGE
jgi:hypothetical protein